MFYKKHQHTRHEFSALCKWPLSREWTQIKINHPSHHGDISIVHTQESAQHQDHTLHHHFTPSSKRRFNVTLANILGQSDGFWTFIQQTFIITSLWQAPYRKTCPVPSRCSWTCGQRELVTTKLGDNRRRQSSQPPRDPRAGLCNSEQWSQASHTHVDPEDELESVRPGGQSRRKMGSVKVQSERWQGGVREMLTRYLNERWRNSLKTWSRTKGTVFS